MMWSNCSASLLTRGTIASPSGTPSAPPGQKSFCMSTRISTSSGCGFGISAIMRSIMLSRAAYSGRYAAPQGAVPQWLPPSFLTIFRARRGRGLARSSPLAEGSRHDWMDRADRHVAGRRDHRLVHLGRGREFRRGPDGGRDAAVRVLRRSGGVRADGPAPVHPPPRDERRWKRLSLNERLTLPRGPFPPSPAPAPRSPPRRRLPAGARS